MDLNQKKQIVAQLERDLSGCKSAIFVDYTSGGVGARYLAELRSRVKDAGGYFRVVRNSLARRALSSFGGESILQLTGPTAIIFSFSESLGPLRILREAGSPFEGLDLKGGVFEGSLVSSAELMKLAHVPNREWLLRSFILSIQSPMRALIATISAPLSNFYLIVEKLNERNEVN